MTLRRLRQHLTLAAAGAAMAVILAEVGLRLFYPQALLHDPDAFMPDPDLEARLKPGFTDRVVTTEFASTWRINEDGYRGPRAGERGPAAFRIAALGDSFTFGYGVEEEDAWPRRLEATLDEGRSPSARVEVANLGVGGYGTFHEVAWLERVEQKVRPDLAVVEFYVGNDPADNARFAQRGAQRNGVAVSTELDPGAGRVETIKRWMGSRLHLFALVSSRADELLVRLGARRLVYPFEMEVLLKRPPPVVDIAWRATDDALRRLAELSRRRGLKILVAVIPMRHQVSEMAWQRLLRHYGGPSAAPGFDRDGPQGIVRALCEREGLPLFDLMAGFREEAARLGVDGREFYWSRDQHFNGRGHALAARLIAERLTRDGWIVAAGR